jgi:hypothetical protein
MIHKNKIVETNICSKDLQIKGDPVLLLKYTSHLTESTRSIYLDQD